APPRGARRSRPRRGFGIQRSRAIGQSVWLRAPCRFRIARERRLRRGTPCSASETIPLQRRGQHRVRAPDHGSPSWQPPLATLRSNQLERAEGAEVLYGTFSSEVWWPSAESVAA